MASARADAPSRADGSCGSIGVALGATRRHVSMDNSQRTGLSAYAALVALLVALGMPGGVAADEITVPAELQVRLLDRVLRYERGFAATSTPVTVLVVLRPGAPESERFAAQLSAALTTARTVGAREAHVVRHRFVSVGRLQRRVVRRSATIVYLSAGIGRDVAGIVAALPSPGVVLVSAVGGDGDHGATLAFELASARPRIVVNLGAASRQHLEFSAHLLRVARVVR